MRLKSTQACRTPSDEGKNYGRDFDRRPERILAQLTGILREDGRGVLRG